VAELTGGFSDKERVELEQRLSKRVRPRPVVPCGKKAQWVDPDILCQVHYLQWTAQGRLRDASFRGLIERSDEPGGLPLPNAEHRSRLR
jgi:bifunctional non-homologous end joining protein LigD